MCRMLPLCILCILGVTAFPAFQPAASGDPAPLPDLYPELYFYVDNGTTSGATAGTPVTVVVVVGNLGPGNISSANVTIYIDGNLAAVRPVVLNLIGEGDFGAAYDWNTTPLEPGNHTVRAQVNDSSGDADPTNDAVERAFTLARSAPVLALELDTGVIEVAVTESAAGVASFSCTAVVSELGGLVMDINLTAQVDIGWAARLLPSSIHADRDGRHRFTVEVTVPQGSPASRFGKLTVQARGQTAEETLERTVEGLVRARPYYRMTMESAVPRLDIDTGGAAFFTVRVTNAGNARDTYEIAVENLLELVNRGWTVVLSANTLAAIDPGNSKTVSVLAQSPQEWTMGRTDSITIDVQVTSQGARSNHQNVSVKYPLYVSESGANPAWYNMTTIGVIVVGFILIAAVGIWRWRAGKGEPWDTETVNRGTGEPVNRGTVNRETGEPVNRGTVNRGTGEPVNRGTVNRETGEPVNRGTGEPGETRIAGTKGEADTEEPAVIVVEEGDR